MHARIRIDLHVDAFGLVDGGAWTVYGPNGRKLACEVTVGFPHQLLPMPAAAVLVQSAEEHCRRQLTLF